MWFLAGLPLVGLALTLTLPDAQSRATRRHRSGTDERTRRGEVPELPDPA